MSVEFVEPEEPDVAVDPGSPAVAARRPSALLGRLVGAAAVVAAALVGLSTSPTFYTVLRTVSIPDFDGTHTSATAMPYDVFGHVGPARTVSAGGSSGAYSSEFSIQVDGAVSYGWWWCGLGAVLLVLGAWALVRPRSGLTGVRCAGIAALGAALLAAVGTAWLTIRSVATTSVPGIRLSTRPDLALWLLVAAGAVSLLAGLVGSLGRLRRRPV